jgi:hypothetical protein
MYVCVCMHVCMNVCLYKFMYECMFVWMYAFMYVCIMYVWMHVCMYVCMYICMNVCMYVCIYVCVNACVYVCIYVCMYECVAVAVRVGMLTAMLSNKRWFRISVSICPRYLIWKDTIMVLTVDGLLLLISWHILGAFEKLRKPLLASSCLSVCPHGTTRPPLAGFPWNLIFEYFFENLSTEFKSH